MSVSWAERAHDIIIENNIEKFAGERERERESEFGSWKREARLLILFPLFLPGIAPPCWRPNATVARESVTWHANALLRPQLVPTEEASNATSVERWVRQRDGRDRVCCVYLVWCWKFSMIQSIYLSFNWPINHSYFKQATWRATAKLTEPKPGLEHKETRVIEKPSKDPFLFFIHIRGKKIQSYHHDIFIPYISINRKISFLFVKSDLVLRSPFVIDLLFPTLFRFEWKVSLCSPLSFRFWLMSYSKRLLVFALWL